MECKITETHRIAEVVRDPRRSFRPNFPAQGGCSGMCPVRLFWKSPHMETPQCSAQPVPLFNDLYRKKKKKKVNIVLFTVVSEYCKLLYNFISMSRKEINAYLR